MIHVLATITAKPGMRESVLHEMAANIPAVWAEDGCIEYGPAVDLEGAGPIQTPLGPDTFVVVEKWASLDALKAHVLAFVRAYNSAKHLKALRWRTPFQAICDAWTKDRSIFKINPHHLIPGPNRSCARRSRRRPPPAR